MLVRSVFHRMGLPSQRDESGAVLVTVVIVMLVGFVIATTIAASVMFTIGANDVNKDRTEAFIAAESGRDVVLSQIVAPGCTSAKLPASNTVAATPPRFTAAATDCFDDYANSSVTITSTGTAPDGSKATTTSVYQRQVTFTNQPGGTMSYFSGQFLATHSSYAGDLVVRDGSYACNSSGVINGDLWVPNGNVTLSTKCDINGSIYAKGTITISSAQVVVTGDLVAGGEIKVTANNTVIGNKAGKTGGNVYTNGNFTLDSKSEMVGKYVVGGTASVAGASVGKPSDSVDKCSSTSPLPAKCNSATPATTKFDPSLQTVYDMTEWVDLPLTRGAWGSDGAGGSNVQWQTGSCTTTDVMGALTGTLSAPYTRVGVDYTACPGPVTIKISGGATKPVTHDVVFLVAPGSPMTVQIDDDLKSTLNPKAQLFFIRGDANITNSVPNCGTSSASDAFDTSKKNTIEVRMMFYTPCGLKRSNQNGLVFNGQFYSNYDNDTHLVHPEFTCQPMTWIPMLDLSCKIANATTSTGTPTITVQPPVLISQTE